MKLEVLKRQLAEIEQQIANFGTVVELPARALKVKHTERYAGTVLDKDGSILHDLVATTLTIATLSYDDALLEAKSLGYSLPSIAEAYLVKANCDHLLASSTWTTQAIDKEFAWVVFPDGACRRGLKTYKFSTVFVRRIKP